MLPLTLIAVLITALLLLLIAFGDSAPAARPPGKPVSQQPESRPNSPSASHKERKMNGTKVSSVPAHSTANDQRQTLDAAKAIHAFDFILKSFAQTPPWSATGQRDDYAHDLAVMLRHRDLQHASLELLGADERILYRHRIEFGKAGQSRTVDAARGIELPLLDGKQIAKHRILVGPVARLDDYRGELRNSWGRAKQLRDCTASRFASEHTSCVNAGRMNGEVFVSDDARQTVTVLNVVADGQYAFAHTPGLPANVFLHRAQCQGLPPFQAGQRLSCIIIQTPRGLQGRSVRLAPQNGNRTRKDRP